MCYVNFNKLIIPTKIIWRTYTWKDLIVMKQVALFVHEQLLKKDFLAEMFTGVRRKKDGIRILRQKIALIFVAKVRKIWSNVEFAEKEKNETEDVTILKKS